jgi:GNAT superfamily N-acetyltransferase
LQTPFRQLSFVECSPNLPEAVGLLDALSNQLLERFASDGRQSFENWRYDDPLHVFIVAKFGEEPVGCGAIRPIVQNVGEIKRMFSKYRRRGIGTAVLHELERQARMRNYQSLWLETRKANSEAVAFYVSQSYRIRKNFGKYIDNADAVCFEKRLSPENDLL